MCGRYKIDISQPEMAKIFKKLEEQLNDPSNTQSDQKQEQLAQVSSGEIFPTNFAPILHSPHHSLEPTIARWGFTGFKSPSHVVFNSRAETVEEKQMFSKPFRETRCIIPATGFYEWSGPKGARIKHLFNVGTEDIIYMAGLYREEIDGKRYSIITTAAQGEIKRIHNRMPVLMYSNWLLPYLEDLDFARKIVESESVLPRFA